MRGPLVVLLRALLPPGDRESVFGEMEELYRARVKRSGPRAARAWRRRQVMGFLVRLVSEGRRDRRLPSRSAVRRESGLPWRGPGPGDLVRELRVSVRSLLRARGFAAVSVLSLALGLGAAATVFTIAYALLFRPLPFQEPDRLVGVMHGEWGNHAYPTFLALRDELSDVLELAAHDEFWYGELADDPVFLREGDRATPLSLAMVSGEYFSVLGVAPALGRPILPHDNRIEGGNPVAVLSWDFWQREFGGDPDVLGRTMTLDLTTYEVVGVAAEGFHGISHLSSADLWIPAVMRRAVQPPEEESDIVTRPDWHWIDIVGRIKPGVSLAVARSRAEAVVASSPRIPESLKEEHLTLTPLKEAAIILPLRERNMRYLTMLFLGVGLVVLVVCANVTNLLMGRMDERSAELAVRRALGAGRLTLARQLILEMGLLAGLGGVGALLFSTWISPVFFRLIAPGMRLSLSASDLSPDPGVLGFILLLVVLTGLLIGGASGLRHRGDSMSLLIRGGRSSWGATRQRLFSFQNLLVMGQLTASIVLLVGTGLLFRSFLKLEEQDVGMDTENVLAVTLGTERIPMDPPAGVLLYDRVLERIRAMSGVESAALAKVAPLSGVTWGGPMQFEGYEAAEGERTNASENYVDPGFFETMGVDLLRGRGFSREDRMGSESVAVVTESVVRRYFPASEPLGKTIGWQDGESFRIVGVVRDHFYASLRRGVEPIVYVPLAQQYQKNPVILVRSREDPLALLPLIRAAVSEILPELVLYDEATMDQMIRASTDRVRATSKLLLSFSFLALLLALMGTYGVVSRMVVRRWREIGIRTALGAEDGEILSLLFENGMRVVGMGIGMGLLLAMGAGVVLRSMIFGVTPADTITLGGVALLFAVAGAAACLVPVRKALRVDPVEVLKAE